MVIKALWQDADGNFYESSPVGKTATGVDALTADGVNYYILVSPQPVKPVDVVERLRESARQKLNDLERRALGL